MCGLTMTVHDVMSVRVGMVGYGGVEYGGVGNGGGGPVGWDGGSIPLGNVGLGTYIYRQLREVSNNSHEKSASMVQRFSSLRLRH